MFSWLKSAFFSQARPHHKEFQLTGVGKNRDIGMDEGLQKKQAWHAYLPCDLKFCSHCFNDDLESSGGAFFVPMLPYDGPVSRVTSSQLLSSTPLPWGILPAFHRAP